MESSAVRALSSNSTGSSTCSSAGGFCKYGEADARLAHLSVELDAALAGRYEEDEFPSSSSCDSEGGFTGAPAGYFPAHAGAAQKQPSAAPECDDDAVAGPPRVRRLSAWHAAEAIATPAARAGAECPLGGELEYVRAAEFVGHAVTWEEDRRKAAKPQGVGGMLRALLCMGGGAA
jgi:hypothetical protein